MPRVYISPSTQEHNIGVPPFTNEQAQMNKIVDELMPLLISDGRYVIMRNMTSMTPSQAAADSNEFKADIHIAIHSNAGGGVGTEAYAYGPGTNSERLTKALYGQIAPLSPGADRGVKYKPELTEVGDRVDATSALIELGFHDNVTDATWLANEKKEIAWALYKGVCDFYGYEYIYTFVAKPIAPVTPVVKVTVPDPDIFLTVRCRISKADQAIVDINKLGFAAKKLELA